MLLIISFSGLVCLCIWFILRADPPKLNNKYSQPGKWYWLKRLIFSVVLQVRKRKQKKNTTLQNDIFINGVKRGYGISDSDPGKMDSVQPVDFDPMAIDSTYFAGFSPNGTNIVMRIAKRPDRCGEIWLFLDLPGIGQFQHPVHPDVHTANNDSSSFNISGLQFQVLEPMKRWKLSYCGLLRVGLHNEIDSQPSQFVTVQMSFIWQAFSEVFNFDTDTSSKLISDGVAREPWTKDFIKKLQSKHQTHYEQWGELRGTIKIDGFEEETVRLKTLRDHTYGVRDWRLFQRYAIHFVYLETGVVAQIGVICQQDIFTHLKIGYLAFPNSDMVPISDVNLNLWDIVENGDPPQQYSFTFWADGIKFDIEVTRGTTPIFYHHKDRGCKILESFCTYKVNGVKGRGLTEYCYRNFEGPSYVQDVSLPYLCEPSVKDLVKDCDILNTVSFTDLACCSSQIVGGKGSQLALLTKIQHDVDAVVPKGFCVTLAAFDKQIQANPNLSKLIDKVCLEAGSSLQFESSCNALVNEVAKTDMVDSIYNDIITNITHIQTTRVAVRSSAAGEDGSEASSAGQMDTLLGIMGTKQIINAVKQCWASAYTFLAVEYRRQNGQPIKTSVGVVIQEMVEADTAGVLFTADPVNGDSSVISINANYGLGESVVSGKSDPDTITVKKEWKDQIKIGAKIIGGKQLQIYVDEKGGIRETNVKDSSQCCLNDNMILKLAHIAVQLEKYFGNSRDIEWAVKDNTVYLLQCRPITTSYKETDEELMHEFDSGLTCDTECLTTGNIGEMMPGAVTPLSYSVFGSAIDSGLQDFLYSFKGKRQISSNMTGIKCACNHLFISLYHVESIIMSVGGTTREAGELSLLGEVLSIVTVEDLYHYVGKKTGFFKKLINFIIMIRTIKNSTSKMENIKSSFSSINIEGDECSRLYEAISANLPAYYKVWSCTMVISSKSSSWSGVLLGILSKNSNVWTSEHYGDLAMLLAQCNDVLSAEVPTAMQNVAKVIADEGQRDLFIQSTDKECYNIIQNNSDISHVFNQFLNRHGHRCLREGELFEKSWKSQPLKLMSVLKAILQSKSYLKTAKKSIHLENGVDKIKTPLSSIAKWILKKLLPVTRRAVGTREWGKSVAVEMSEVFKQAYWKLAKLLVEEGYIPDKDLMFYLTHYEIGRLLKTRSAKLIMRAKRRRKLHDKQMSLKFIKTVSGYPQIVNQDVCCKELDVNYTWTGMPVSQGTANGPARVVTKLEDAGSIQSGDILVVMCTDVGWSPYFSLLSGLVTEVGGLVSHGAVIAREYGIPCIVNVPNATLQIKSGDELYIDGQGGTVSRVSSQ